MALQTAPIVLTMPIRQAPMAWKILVICIDGVMLANHQSPLWIWSRREEKEERHTQETTAPILTTQLDSVVAVVVVCSSSMIDDRWNLFRSLRHRRIIARRSRSMSRSITERTHVDQKKEDFESIPRRYIYVCRAAIFNRNTSVKEVVVVLCTRGDDRWCMMDDVLCQWLACPSEWKENTSSQK